MGWMDAPGVRLIQFLFLLRRNYFHQYNIHLESIPLQKSSFCLTEVYFIGKNPASSSAIPWFFHLFRFHLLCVDFWSTPRQNVHCIALPTVSKCPRAQRAAPKKRRPKVTYPYLVASLSSLCLKACAIRVVLIATSIAHCFVLLFCRSGVWVWRCASRICDNGRRPFWCNRLHFRQMGRTSKENALQDTSAIRQIGIKITQKSEDRVENKRHVLWPGWSFYRKRKSYRAR